MSIQVLMAKHPIARTLPRETSTWQSSGVHALCQLRIQISEDFEGICLQTYGSTLILLLPDVGVVVPTVVNFAYWFDASFIVEFYFQGLAELGLEVFA